MDLLEDVLDVIAPTWIVKEDVRGAARLKQGGVEHVQHTREDRNVIDLRLGLDMPSRALLDDQLSDGAHGRAIHHRVQLFDTCQVLVDNRRCILILIGNICTRTLQ